MSAAILALLLRGNLAVSAAILVVLMLRRPVRRRFGAAASYALWLAAPLCLLVALAPPSAPPGLIAPVIAPMAADLAAAKAQGLRLPSADDWAVLVTVVWLSGALASAALFALRQARFVRTLGPLTPWAQDRSILIAQGSDAGPLVLGLFRPRIVAPADFETRFEGQARALVLAHERVHLARGDAIINGLTVAVQCLAWFNPLIHLAARALRVDQEIACDAAVLAAQPQSRRLYAETLIGALSRPMAAPLACHWPAVGVHPLKERLVTLGAAALSPRRRAIGLGLAAVVGLAAAGAVWAANPAPREPIREPDWLLKPTGADLAAVYPAEAARARLAGATTIECSVAGDGRLRACEVLTESPTGAGFGAASLKLSETFRMAPVARGGERSAGGVVRIPIRFAMAPAT